MFAAVMMKMQKLGVKKIWTLLLLLIHQMLKPTTHWPVTGCAGVTDRCG